MKIRLAVALAATFALSACSDSDWSRGMSFVGLDDNEPAPVAAAKAAPVPAQTARTAPAAGNNAFCAAVARQDSERNPFDAPTQQGVFTRSFQQCMTIFGGMSLQ
ncbi:MAG: hypothetical protein JSR25_04975 [Proteobacteria bacterium]|nr:hypothetical protein [Pseudomonadota bacterium]